MEGTLEALGKLEALVFHNNHGKFPTLSGKIPMSCLPQEQGVTDTLWVHLAILRSSGWAEGRDPTDCDIFLHCYHAQARALCTLL